MRSIARGVALCALLAVPACATSPSAASATLELVAMNDSGVTGTVVVTRIDDRTTLVEVLAEHGEFDDMPAHVHPGSCADLVPQPRYALENVVDGHSTTRVAASFAELTASGQAVNLHRSNDEMDVYTACVDL